MGGQQSSESSGASNPPPTSCYYELLGVSQTASSDDIRKAYRRRALELHPDKNIEDSENASRRFAQLQAAYEILSDPQERAWYDSHRDAILHGRGTGESQESEFRNVRVTSAEEIVSLVGRFNTAVPFSDEPGGFFGELRDVFDRLATEEVALGDYKDSQAPTYPSFGASTDEYETVVRSFYTAWLSFSTHKSFAWKDKYRLSDAPDRRVRRLMEKENKKLREDAIKEFNEAVRFLVNFSRKRDPRYIANAVSNSDRQKALRDVVAAQAARSRAANQEKLHGSVVPEWIRTKDEDAALTSEDEESDVDIEHIECIICNKIFKSENQYQAHERSKKHTKAVQQLRHKMRREDRDLNLDRIDNQASLDPKLERTSESDINSSDVDPDMQDQGGPDETVPEYESSDSPVGTLGPPLSSATTTISKSSTYDQDEAGMDNLTRRPGDAHDHENPPVPKVGKAKAKRDKRAARQEAAARQSTSTLTCNVCNEHFVSRTKLFAHIRTQGHAAPHNPTSRVMT